MTIKDLYNKDYAVTRVETGISGKGSTVISVGVIFRTEIETYADGRDNVTEDELVKLFGKKVVIVDDINSGNVLISELVGSNTTTATIIKGYSFRQVKNDLSQFIYFFLKNALAKHVGNDNDGIVAKKMIAGVIQSLELSLMLNGLDIN